VSIRKHRRAFQQVRKQARRNNRLAGTSGSAQTVGRGLLRAYARYSRALSRAFWFRHDDTEWGRRHPKLRTLQAVQYLNAHQVPES
jgi:hypothetical protein